MPLFHRNTSKIIVLYGIMLYSVLISGLLAKLSSDIPTKVDQVTNNKIPDQYHHNWLTVAHVTDTRIELKWTELPHLRSNLSYQIICVQDNNNSTTTTRIATGQLQLNLTNLLPNTKYIIRLELNGPDGTALATSQSVLVLTEVRHQRNPPNYNISCISQDTIFLQFYNPKNGTEGPFDYFYVLYSKRMGNSSDFTVQTVNTQKDGDDIGGTTINLNPSATYKIKVQSGTNSVRNPNMVVYSKYSDVQELKVQDCWKNKSSGGNSSPTLINVGLAILIVILLVAVGFLKILCQNCALHCVSS